MSLRNDIVSFWLWGYRGDLMSYGVTWALDSPRVVVYFGVTQLSRIKLPCLSGI